MLRSIALLLSLAVATTASEVTATIDTSRPGRAIPKSFAGLSREWRRFPYPESGRTSEVHPAYLRLLAHLCAFNDEALSIRIGGRTADGATEVPAEPERWAQMARVFETTRTPLIIGIGLARGDAELAKNWVRTANATLPKGAVASFELGNEPDGWPGRHKPADHTFGQYLDEFHAIGSQLVPELTGGLAGPAWAHGAPRDILTTFAARQKGLLNLLTAHGYRFDPKRQPGIEKLLDDHETVGFAERIRPGIEAAHGAGLKLRLSETGSAWSGGIPGFSDSFAAALFTLDLLFEFASAGLDGVNLHHVGMNAYSPIKEDTNKAGQTHAVTASAPYYGMLVFAEAVSNEGRLVAVEGGGKAVKLWALLDKAGTLRVVAINKHLTEPAGVSLRTGAHRGAVTLKRLEAPSPGATSGITYAGRTFDGSRDGNPIGTLNEEAVAIHGDAIRLNIRPASAVLVTVAP